jgi:hypothetical protein
MQSNTDGLQENCALFVNITNLLVQLCTETCAKKLLLNGGVYTRKPIRKKSRWTSKLLIVFAMDEAGELVTSVHRWQQ